MAGEALARLVDALTGYGSWTNGRAAQCPHHDDGTASLSISGRRDGGGVVIDCHAGCDYRDVLADLGLTVGDLYDKGSRTRELIPSPRRATQGRPKPRKPPRRRGQIIDEYPYTDEEGRELFRAVRFDPKGFGQCRMVDGRREWSLAGVRLVPYHLPKVIAAVAAGRDVWICEGEKDVHALERAGVAAATCNPMGGGPGKWHDEFSAFLDGADVVIVADRDDTGRAHAKEVAASLKRHVRYIWIVEAAEGKDAADHLAAGRSLAEFSLVSEVCGVKNGPKVFNAAKWAGLRKLARKVRPPVTRPVLEDPARRQRKLTVETGSTRLDSFFYHAPREPWTCPDPDAAMNVYERIMTGERLYLRDFTADDIAALAYQVTEQLITIGPADMVIPLGDCRATGAKYPGAPMPNAPAGGGGKKQLRHHGDKLVELAVLNMALAGDHRAETYGGMRASARQVCAVANDIKSKRPDLDGYRYMSVDTCSRIIRRLLKSRRLIEAEPFRRVREHRTWRTIPRVFDVRDVTPEPAEQLGLKPPGAS